METPFPGLPIPRLARVRQELSEAHLADVPAAIRAEMGRLNLTDRVGPGKRVAICAGSRGIADIPIVVRTVSQVVRELGAEPFVVPAMGSHGGATAEGQRAVLAEYGITQDSVGCPIRATMETVDVGVLANGTRVHFDAEAAAADATIVVNRVKAHTAFRAGIESGLCKMTAVGLGKQRGAEQVHAHGLAETIPDAAALTLERMNVVAGIALVENAYHQLAVVRAASADRFHALDAELLGVANELLPRIPFEHLHLLVLAWMGKNLSGSGMDYNVVGMWRRIGGTRQPDYERLVVLDLTEESNGNALGMGIADFTTQRLRDKVDLRSTYMNGLTANAIDALKTPIVLPDARSAMSAALHSVGHAADARMVMVRSTLDLGTFWASEALLPEIALRPELVVEEAPTELSFDASGWPRLLAEPALA